MRSCSDSAAVTTAAVDLHHRKKKLAGGGLRWVEHKNTATEERKNEQKLQTTVSNGSDLIFLMQLVCSTSAATKSTKCRYSNVELAHVTPKLDSDVTSPDLTKQPVGKNGGLTQSIQSPQCSRQLDSSSTTTYTTVVIFIF